MLRRSPPGWQNEPPCFEGGEHGLPDNALTETPTSLDAPPSPDSRVYSRSLANRPLRSSAGDHDGPHALRNVLLTGLGDEVSVYWQLQPLSSSPAMKERLNFGLNRLPPLNCLRAFEAAARHKSFTKAADALAVTQGAVSRSVKTLEDYLQTPLFRRTASGIELSEGSQAFARALTDAFAQIGEATENFLTGQTRQVLTILAYPSFSTYWLTPMLPFFQVTHPNIEILLVSALDKTRFDPTTADVRIRYGNGRWNGFESIFLFADEITPVCSPALLGNITGPITPSMLSRVPLLHTNSRRRDWGEWLTLAGAEDVTPMSNLYFAELSVVYCAALAGMGVALGQRAFLQDEVARGRLRQPFDTVLRRSLAYYLTYPEDRRDVPKIALFRRWIETVRSGGPPEITARRPMSEKGA